MHKKHQPKPAKPDQETKPAGVELPTDVRSERLLIGSLLIHPAAIDDCALIVTAADFVDQAHVHLWRVITELHDRGVAPDIEQVMAEAKRQGCWVPIGGAKYVGQLINDAATGTHARFYADQVRDASIRRQLVLAVGETMHEAGDHQMTAGDVLDRAEQRFFRIADQASAVKEVSDAPDVMRRAIDEIERRIGGQEPVGVPTGYHELDAVLGGLRAQQLVILAARPSMGKSALAMNIAEHAAMEGATPVLYVSLEMSESELAERLLCARGRVNSARLRNGTISNAEQAELVKAAGELSRAPILIADEASQTLRHIAALARRTKRKRGLGLVVVDYLQLIEPADSQATREQQVSRIARDLKKLAKNLDVPVLCLAQLNRQAEREGRPKLSHLRESGAIEQDADVVLFIHRDESDEARKGLAELIVAKQRNGPQGVIDLVWRREFTRFDNRAPPRHDEFDSFNEREPEQQEFF